MIAACTIVSAQDLRAPISVYGETTDSEEISPQSPNEPALPRGEDHSADGQTQSTNAHDQDQLTLIEPENVTNDVYVDKTVYSLPTLGQILDLQPIPELDEEVVMNIVYGSLEGCVTNYAGFPLQQVEVTLRTIDRIYTTHTDQEGYYSIAVPKNEYELTFRLYGYGIEGFKIALYEDDFQDCTLCQLLPVNISTSGHKGQKTLRIVRAKINEAPNFSLPDYELLPKGENSFDTILLPIGRYYAKINENTNPKEFWVSKEENVLRL